MENNFFSKAILYPAATGPHAASVTTEADLMAAKRLSMCSCHEARHLIPYQTAKEFNVLPLAIMQDENGERILTIAAGGEINNYERIKTLKFCSDMEIRLINVKPHVLSEAMFIAYFGDDAALANTISKAQNVLHDEKKDDDIMKLAKGEAATFVKGLLDYAISHRASDIHFIPTVSGGILRLRIDGELRENREAINSQKFHKQIIARIKVLSKCGIDRTFVPIDSAFELNSENKRISIRVSIMPTIHGEKAVLRILCNNQCLNLEQLNFSEKPADLLRRYALQSEGAILFSGPTGSGKTTSIYALLALLRDKSRNIVTLEDPVEIELQGISQTSICEAQKFSYVEGLKAILRQDPDVVMLGEIREREVARLALNAALTGHLLLSTLHTRSVLDIPLRLAHFGVDNSLLGQSLNLLITQRLVPRLCHHCKVIDLIASKEHGYEVFQATGCPACDYSGYSGRAVIAEVLIIDKKIRESLAAGSLNAFDLRKIVTTDNYLPMKNDLELLLQKGLISNEIFRKIDFLLN